MRPFQLDWRGYHLRYDAEALRAHRNPLPPLERFQQPKAVLCQHARRGVAWLDAGGTYVTKDVYPIALPKRRGVEGAAVLVALLNSRVFSVLYHLLYRGIAIGGGYLHFLPVFLHEVPIPRIDGETAARLAEQVLALQEAPTAEAFEALDEDVMDQYGLTGEERDAVRTFADRCLGYDTALS
ncbi:MAG: TaqI-like C-terminal specificity domain-containing protein [Myxococcota bacterium]